MLNGVDPLAREAAAHHVAGKEKVGVGFVLGAPDPAAELVEIGQPETVGAIDDDGVGVWNIEPALDDRGADQNVDFSRNEALHDRLQFVRAHLPVAKLHPRARTKLGDPVARFLDRHDAIVQEIDLPLAFELAVDRVANDALVVAADDGLDREAVERRGLDRRHVFDPD